LIRFWGADLAGIDKLPPALSLTVTVLLLATGIAASLWKTRQDAAHADRP
jgi:tellurite resistance protein TerC